MELYAIYDKAHRRFVRYGLNGGNEVGFCLYRGHICAFTTKQEAQSIVAIDLHDPEGYEVRKFKGASSSKGKEA